MHAKQFLNQVFTVLAWKHALCFFILPWLFFLVSLKVIAVTESEPSINHNYTVLCTVALALHAEVAALLLRRKQFFPYLFCWSLPLVYMVAELVNGTCNSQNYMFASVFHYCFFGNCYLLLKWCLREATPAAWKLKRHLSVIALPLEIFLMVVPLMVMANRILTGSGIDSSAIRAMCQTNREEAVDYFFLQNNGAAMLTVLALILPALLIAWRTLEDRPEKTAEQIPLDRLFSYPVVVVTGLVALAVVGSFGHMFTWCFPTSFWRLVHVPQDYLRTIRIYHEGLGERKRIVEELCGHLPQKGGYKGIYVVIVGESLDRNYMSAYGYGKNTSPFQKELRESKQAFFFKEPYSSHVQTMHAVPMMLKADNQYLDAQKRKAATASVSLIDIANRLNMETYWISNQEKMSHFTCQISSLVSTAKTRIFLEEIPGASDGFDHGILKQLEGLQPFPEASMVFIHLAGSHFPYWKCYPQDFVFPPELTDSYDKAVYYNDSVIRELVTFFKRQKAAAIFYASDHSDGVSIGRVHDPRKSRFTMEMAEIPAWVYLSEGYMKDNPDVVQRMRKACDLPFTNDLTFNLMLDIMRLQITLFPQDHSPLHEDYILRRMPPMTLDGQVAIPTKTAGTP